MSPNQNSAHQPNGINGSDHIEELDTQYQNVSSKLLGRIETMRRDHFKKDVIFGCATAAFQVEGAATEGKKGPSIWDNWTHEHSEKVADCSNGDVAIDQYHKFKDDVKLMKDTGLEAYRFSISWPRILPGGTVEAGINDEGIQYYKDLIEELHNNGIEPYVTLFHWDLPHALEVKYGGFLSKYIVKDFTEFANLCFTHFGSRVKNWITFNEGWTYCVYGYTDGSFPPGHGSSAAEKQNSVYKLCGSRGAGSQQICARGDVGTEPYTAAHNMLLAHASVVDMYREFFQETPNGKIGITNNCHFFEPLNDTIEDKNACIRALDWMLGWFVAPIVTGDYPPSMRKTLGDRLPKFTPSEKDLIKGSYDFLGLNYYTTMYATNTPRKDCEKPTYLSDQGLTTHHVDKDNNPIGDPTGATWLYIVPRGIYNLLVYVKETYKAELIYITENGMAEAENPSLTISKARLDPLRIRYYNEHLWYLRKAIDDGVNVKAYFLWSFADNFEWAQGYESRFGIFYIDYKNGLSRVPKSSALWWKSFFSKKSIKREGEELESGSDKKPKVDNA